MAKLFLKFIDEYGEEQEVSIEQEEFIVGRHSDNDLSIVNSKLSRQHIKIQRFADVFIVTDLDSSNGTTLNGEELEEPIAIKNGDVLNLGGGIDIDIEVDDPNAVDNSSDENEEEAKEKSASASAGSSGGGSAGNTSSVSSQSSGGGSGIGKALILAPVLGLLILFTAVGAMFIISGNGNKELTQDTNEDGGFITTSTPDNEKDSPQTNTDNENVTKTPIPNDTPQTNDTNNTDLNKPVIPEDTPSSLPTGNGTTNPPPIPDQSDNIGIVRSNSFKFMRKIARSNQKPVLLSNQLKILENKINSFKGSRALINNIKNAQRNSSAIQALASSKNLKPQFLVTAALARLGNSSGNVLAKAQEMADVLDNLNIQIGDEQADDNLIIIAAYDQGMRGENLKMRNTLQRLAGKNPNRASEIRTIWFLKEKNAISGTQFELALRFLAIGTITQNPKAFNVNANALVLN